jgi:diguanylate cyclase (GGDEF)-like protein
MHFHTLPNLLALSMLVLVFWAISRKAMSAQVETWLVGWFLVLLHFVAESAAVTERWSSLRDAVSLDGLVLAGIAFLVSVSTIATSRRRQLELALVIGLPALSFVDGLIYGVAAPIFYYVLIAIGLMAPLLFLLHYNQQGRAYAAGAIAALFLVTGAMAWAVASGNQEQGITIILASLYFAAGILYGRLHKRSSAGVLTAVVGLFFWGAVFPTAVLLGIFLPSVKVESEVWNIPKYLVAVGMILTLLEDQIARSTYLACHDELTELPNRRLLEDRLEQALAQAARNASKVAVFVLDLDHFKEVNDNFGHRVGDTALRKVVTRLSSRLRASDTLARSGGDEFTVVSHVTSDDGAGALLQGLESALEEPILVEGRLVQTGISIGVAIYPDDGCNADELYAAADRAMYVAKRASRNLRPAAVIHRNFKSNHAPLV